MKVEVEVVMEVVMEVQMVWLVQTTTVTMMAGEVAPGAAARGRHDPPGGEGKGRGEGEGEGEGEDEGKEGEAHQTNGQQRQPARRWVMLG